MRNRLYQFNDEMSLKIPLDIHVGINTGLVIAGDIGSEGKMDYSVMGDTVNLAARLEEVAERGKIYVGPMTHRQTKSGFEYEQLEPISLKGKEEPIIVFELLSRMEKVYRARLGTERMIYSEMVGRDKELGKLELHVHKAINGEGSIVSVIGEAGIGKSRLIAELRNKKVIKRITFLEGRAVSTGKNLSFHPIIDILKHWAGIKEDDTPLQSLEKLESATAKADPDGLDEIIPFIATLMGIRLTGAYAERTKSIEGEALEKLILKNTRDLIAKVASGVPVVLVLEDLHWADQSSIELLESFYRLANSHSILFVNIFRPGYEETGERLLRTINERHQEIHSTIRLNPLDSSQCEILINNLLKTSWLPPHIKEHITAKAEGNPFFIEEVGRSFIDEGVVVLKDGQFEVTEKVEKVVIPETIQDVLMARIDRLDEESKSLVKVASVIGRTFFYKILAEVAKTIDSIDNKLDYLKEIQLIRERERMKELEYLFKHALVQEATYTSILLQKRKELHIQIASSIEAIFSERLHEFYGLLALHYSQGENLDKAEEYLIKAGEEALKSAASSEALNYYQEALRLYFSKHGERGDPATIATLRRNIAIAHFNKGHMFDAVANIDLVLEYWGERRKKNQVSKIFSLLGNLFVVLSRLYIPSLWGSRTPRTRDIERLVLTYYRGRALAYIDTNRFFIDTIVLLRLCNRFDITKIDDGAIIYYACSALFSFSGLSFAISKKIQDYGQKFLNKEDKKAAFAFRFYELIHDVLCGNWKEVRDYDEEGIDYSASIGELFSAITYSLWYSYIHTCQGHFEDAKKSVNKMRVIADNFDSDDARVSEYIGRIFLLSHQRFLSDALDVAEEAVKFYDKTNQNLPAIKVMGIKAYVQLIMNDYENAELTVEAANRRIEEEKSIVPYYITDISMSQFILNIHKLDKAIKSNERADFVHIKKTTFKSGKKIVRIANKNPVYKAEAYQYMGTYYWLIGNERKARFWWGKSIKVGEEMMTSPMLARSYMEIGRRILESKSPRRELLGIGAEEYLEMARSLFESMNLEWDLKELSNFLV
jgi:type II secretory pathway predicted ATPase ExeA/tetratricopeptide (TPR) repeat protein